MSFRWLHLGAASLFFVGVNTASAQPPHSVERDGGLLPPSSTPPVVQVVARQPADEEEVLVEVIKVMPRIREEAEPKEVKNDNFRIIKMKRDDDAPPAPRLLARPAGPSQQASHREPLQFLPQKQQEQLPTAVPAARSAEETGRMFPGEKAVKIVKVPVHEKPQPPAAVESTWLTFALPTIPNPFRGYPGAVGDCMDGTVTPPPPLSAVGWIDPAIVATQARFRYDSRFHNERPDRAEYFLARNQQFFTGVDTGINGRGFPIPERSIDMREASLYVEYAFAPRVSAFVEGTVREMDPDQNANSTGLGDMNAGVKVAYFMLPGQIQTFQLRVFIPTGRPETGLGNGHATLEPALLLWQRLSEDWTLESEIRDWIPLGGTNYAGNVLRYGLGLSYTAYRGDRWAITPVGEIIGWSILRGKESRFVNLLPTDLETVETRGSIFEAALGCRGQITDRCDWYLGYARSLTTAKAWFDDNVRFELRWRY